MGNSLPHEERDDPLLSLLLDHLYRRSQGEKFSFNLDVPQKLKEWSSNYPNEEVLYDSPLQAALQKEIDRKFTGFDLGGDYKSASPNEKSMNAFQEVNACIKALLNSPVLASAIYAEYNRLSENCPNPCGYNSFMPLGNISPDMKEDLIYYIRMFVSPEENLENLSYNELKELYLKYTPNKVLGLPVSKAKLTDCNVCKRRKTACYHCYYCGSGHCMICPMEEYAFPQLNVLNKSYFCDTCAKICHQECTDLWMEKAVSLVQDGSTSSLYASIGCMSMAVYAGGSPSEDKMLECLKSMYKKGYSYAALPLTINFIQACKNEDLLVQARYYLANMLYFVARKNCDEQNRDNLFFLSAAEEAFDSKSIYGPQSKSSIELPHLSRLKSEVQLHLDQRKTDFLAKLELLWNEKSWKMLINVVANEKSNSLLDAECCNVMKKFIAEKETSDEEERNVLVFLRAKLSINEGNILDGVEKIETAIWNHSSPSCLQMEAVAIMIELLPKIQTSNNTRALMLANTLLKGPTEDISPRIEMLAFSSLMELEPPQKLMFARNIRNLDISMYEREKSILQKYGQGRLTKQDVADGYVSLMSCSDNYSQNIMCHLLAALWYLQHFHDIPHHSLEHRFAMKKLIFYLLKQTVLKTRIYHSHPGFQMYAESLSLRIIINVLQNGRRIISPDDTELAAQVLYTVLQKCRMCPLWEAPIVLMSEVDHLEAVTDTLHTEYLKALEKLVQTQLPIKQAELNYYLYEGDLRRKKRAGSESSYLEKSMEELLKEKSWSYEDVVQRMNSPMDPRDSEGWLLLTPGQLGVSYEYSELKGMVVDIEAPSIKLVFEPASASKLGLLSLSDVMSFMQLDIDDVFPLHFSLDPPDPEKPYHPFQEVVVNKKLPRAIQHTLLQTDYLMKSFSVGSDVSSKPPFKQRPCKEGLTKHLPKNLQEATRSINERSERKTGMSMSRFWIQADRVHYEVSQSSSKIEFRFGDVDIKVRSHPIIPGPDGNLTDTDEDLDPNSAEAHFAADLTNNYQQLGYYFPEYARLYELGKLQAVKYLLCCIEKSLKDSSNSLLGHNSFQRMLSKFKSVSVQSDNSCNWVPAALHEEHTFTSYSRCYGGVLFAPKLVQSSNIPKFSSATLLVPIKPLNDDEDTSSDSAFTRLIGYPSQNEHFRPTVHSRKPTAQPPSVPPLHSSQATSRPLLQAASRKTYSQQPRQSLTSTQQTKYGLQPRQQTASSQKPRQNLTSTQQTRPGLQPRQQTTSQKTYSQQPRQNLKSAPQARSELQQVRSDQVLRANQQQYVRPSSQGHGQYVSTAPVSSNVLSYSASSPISSSQTSNAGPPASTLAMAHSRASLKSTSLVNEKMEGFCKEPFVDFKHDRSLPSELNSSMEDFVSQVEDTQTTMRLPLSLLSSFWKQISFKLTTAFLAAQLKGKTDCPKQNAGVCSCHSAYKCLISQLMSKVDSFSCNGKKYRLKSTFINCDMKNVVYMIKIKFGDFEENYVGLTMQRMWKRAYQHLSDAFRKFATNSIIHDKNDRRVADRLASCLQDVDSSPDCEKTRQRKKELLIELISKSKVEIIPLAMAKEQPGMSKDFMKKILQSIESRLIELFDTKNHGANKISGVKVDNVDIEKHSIENFFEE